MPLVEGVRVECADLFDAFHQVIAQVLVGGEGDAVCQFFLGDTRAFCKQVAASVAPIGVDGYGIGAVKVERSAIRQACDGDFSPSGLVTSTV